MNKTKCVPTIHNVELNAYCFGYTLIYKIV